MKIVIAGCGKIGTTITANLTQEGHDVTVIDSSPDVINKMSDRYDVMCVPGSATDNETLLTADPKSAELFLATTDSDETNMLSCFIAKKLGCPNVIARIRNPEYNADNFGFLRQNLGLTSSINPELLVATEIVNILKFPTAIKVENFSRRNLEMLEISLSPDSELDGMKLIKMREKFKANYLVCVVRRGDDVFIPDGNFVLKSGDVLCVTASPEEIQKLLKMLGMLRKMAKNVIIIGGSKISYYLARRCLKAGISVKIVEIDKKRCDELSVMLPGAKIICGNGAEQELLIEEGIDSADAFVMLTGQDEENILLSLFASMRKVPKVIAKVNLEGMASLARKLGVECIVSTKEITSNVIVGYVRALENSHGSNVETLYKIMDGKAEALEFIIKNNTDIINRPLKALKFKDNILIGGIMRGKKTLIPSGDDVILPGDRVIIVASGQRMNDISDILRPAEG
ncbi:MAG: Trk system potassium transporter TrkA [Clostridia bacterium]|nr:Trk system potassium transporter TrkA [Clostridia bacterium]